MFVLFDLKREKIICTECDKHLCHSTRRFWHVQASYTDLAVVSLSMLFASKTLICKIKNIRCLQILPPTHIVVTVNPLFTASKVLLYIPSFHNNPHLLNLTMHATSRTTETRKNKTKYFFIFTPVFFALFFDLGHQTPLNYWFAFRNKFGFKKLAPQE